MTAATARRINSAACQVWCFQHGIVGRVAIHHILVLQSVTVAQIQTATDVIDAINRDAVSTNGRRILGCTLAAEAAPAVKQFADSCDRPPECSPD